MSEFKPGEIVDITIKGVRIDDVHFDGTPDIIAEDSDGLATVWAMPPQAKVERVAPAEWPPQPGDLWKDRYDQIWFAQRYNGDFDDPKDFEGCNSDGWRVVLVPVSGGPYGASEGKPDDINQAHGPMMRVYREGGERS